MNLPNLNLFQRNFASLVISPTRVLAVKLNNKKNKVEVFGQKNIPPGVIMSYRVKEPAKLVEIISSLLKEIKLRDKFVGVVVPEFATYTKTIELPNITNSEIDEALDWQMQEFLPAPIEDVVLDWKIISRKEDKVTILVVAILKDILMGYIDAVGDSGLSPLVVETPSLSIARITLGEDVGKLIIYLSQPEALLVISRGNQIIASSVVSSDNLNIVVSTANQMISHYTEISIEKIIVGGVGITQDLIQNLHYNLGRTVQFLDYKLKGIVPAQLQDYLLGVSLQYKDPVEPASDKTINLLPPQWAETYRRKLIILKTWTLTLIASILTWATFLATLLVLMAITFQVDSFTKSNETSDQLEFNQAISEVRNANSLADKIINIDSRIKSFQEVINAVYAIKPEGVNLSIVSVNMETGEIVITGVASARADLIEFKNAMDDSGDIGAVDFPLTNLIQETNINFDFKTRYNSLATPAKPTIKLNI